MRVREGIDGRDVVRQALIDWRDVMLLTPDVDFSRVVLLSHAIWWLAEDKDTQTPNEKEGSDNG